MQKREFERATIYPMAWTLLCVFFAFYFANSSHLLALQDGNLGQKESIKSQKGSVEIQNRKIQIGVSGHLRLGCWAEIRVEAKNGDPAGLDLVAEASDAEGNRVRFFWDNRVPVTLGEESFYVGYIKVGRQDREIKVLLKDGQGQTIYGNSVSPMSDPNIVIHPATMALWIQLGSDRELTNVVSSTSGDPDFGLKVIRLKVSESSHLPVEALGWSGFERMVMFAGKEMESSIENRQAKSLENWVNVGGRISVSGTQSLKDLLEDSRFSWLLGFSDPGSRSQKDQKTSISQTRDVSSLEIFASSKTQVFESSRQTLPFLGFEGFDGYDQFQVDDKPVLVFRSQGLGRVDLLGLDFESAPLKTWKSSPSVIRKWVQRDPEGKEPLNVSFGYSDISGQLRTSLERFPSVTLISFTVVIGIVLFFLVCCALDYFLLRNVLKNVQLTWLTLPFYVVAFSGFCVWLFYNQKSQEMQYNQVEVIDVIEETGQVRGRIWSHIYSPLAKKYDVGFQSIGPFDIKLNRSLLSWEGLPGTGLGGMRSKTVISSAPFEYDVLPSWPGGQNGSRKSDETDKSAEDANAEEIQPASIKNVQIPLASTASFTATWQGKMEPKRINSQLLYSERMDRLTGRFTNPLDQKLKNGYLIFGHWAYRLDRTIESGEEIDIQTDTTAISITRWLTQKKELEDASVVTPWDPTTTDMQRILELMMFNQLGGGRDYVRLTHRYRNELDLSHLPSLGQAVFLGRIGKLATKLELDKEPISDSSLQRSATALRLILPVRSIDRPGQ